MVLQTYAIRYLSRETQSCRFLAAVFVTGGRDRCQFCRAGSVHGDHPVRQRLDIEILWLAVCDLRGRIVNRVHRDLQLQLVRAGKGAAGRHRRQAIDEYVELVFDHNLHNDRNWDFVLVDR